MDGTTGEIDAPESGLRPTVRVVQNRRSESELRTHQIALTFPAPTDNLDPAEVLTRLRETPEPGARPVDEAMRRARRSSMSASAVG